MEEKLQQFINRYIAVIIGVDTCQRWKRRRSKLKYLEISSSPPFKFKIMQIQGRWYHGGICCNCRITTPTAKTPSRCPVSFFRLRGNVINLTEIAISFNNKWNLSHQTERGGVFPYIRFSLSGSPRCLQRLFDSWVSRHVWVQTRLCMQTDNRRNIYATLGKEHRELLREKGANAAVEEEEKEEKVRILVRHSLV